MIMESLDHEKDKKLITVNYNFCECIVFNTLLFRFLEGTNRGGNFYNI